MAMKCLLVSLLVISLIVISLGEERKSRRQQGNGLRKRGCKYEPEGEWSACDAENDTKTLTMKLADGPERCEQSKVITKPCDWTPPKRGRSGNDEKTSRKDEETPRKGEEKRRPPKSTQRRRRKQE